MCIAMTNSNNRYALNLLYFLDIKWWIWFVSGVNGFFPFESLKINNLNISNPGKAKKIKISSGLMAASWLWDFIKIYEITKANNWVQPSPRKALFLKL